MKKLLLSAAVVLGAIFSADAQAYYNVNFLSGPGNPGGVNANVDFNTSSLVAPVGSTTILSNIPHAGSTPQYSTSQTLPFAFNFNGGPVTKFRANSSGYITFSKKTVLANAGNTPASLPSALMPDSSVCAWGLCLAGLSGGTCVYTAVYGTAPHRQLWIDWFGATNPTDTCTINWWAIVLEETTNDIYVVDQAGDWYWNGCSSPTNPDLSIGVQISPTLAFQAPGSPAITAIATSAANSDNNYYEFIPGSEPSYSADVIGTNISPAVYYGVGTSNPVTGTIANLGSTALSSLTLNWKCSDGHTGTSAPSVSIATGSIGAANGTSNWTPTAVGTYTMKLWATKLNGSNANADINDTFYVSNIQVIDSIQPKQVMFEEFSCASCNPCMYAMPNIDSVANNTVGYCNTVRYHWYFPGQDMINDVTATLVNTRFETYYGQDGVPDAQIDGATIYPGYGYLSSGTIQAERSIGSPFKIDVSTCTYNRANNLFNFKANIKSFGSFAAGLKAYVVVTVDSIDFKTDQSVEDPNSSFYPPDGTGNTNTDYYYDFILNFPDAVEDMLPSTSGTSLAAFTPNSTQSVSVNWTKNHAWAANYSTYNYDSSSTYHITIWIQDDANHYVYQSAKTLCTSPTGIEGITDGVSFDMYPNPTNNNTNLVFELTKDQNINVEVYNMLGQRVYGNNEGILSSGQHTISIDASNLKNGVYFVRLNADNGTTTQKLIIQR